MVAYWLLYDILKEEGLLEQYSFDSLGDDIPNLDYYQNYEEITGNVTINSEQPTFKFNEDVVLDLVKDYIGETYTKHYVSKDKFQTLDFIAALGDAQAFCRGNAMKYLSRYDKKGTPTLDIKKAMHYCVLLYNFYTMEEASK